MRSAVAYPIEGNMDAVCNASPLITLAKAGFLDVLPQMFDHVSIPQAVVVEVLAGGARDPAVLALSSARWLKRITLEPPASRLAIMHLGAGEAEVIEYAVRVSGSVAVLDDRAARRAARALGIRCTGTLGVLFEAERKELIPSFDEAVERLREAGLYCDERTLAAVRSIRSDV